MWDLIYEKKFRSLFGFFGNFFYKTKIIFLSRFLFLHEKQIFGSKDLLIYCGFIENIKVLEKFLIKFY